MPVIHIKALPQKNRRDPGAIMRRLCCRVAEAVGLPPAQVWATWEDIRPGFYVEGNAPAEEQPDGTHPPIVNILCFEGRPESFVEKMILTTVEVLSKELDLDGNVFLTYTEMKSGRVYTGGAIRGLHASRSA